MTAALELRNVSKRYGGAIALSEVNFDVESGEVHGLIGENGAGKSTMMKLLAGVFNDYDGEMLLRGQAARLASPADAQAKDIDMVHQELSTFAHLTVAENLFGRKLPSRAGVVDWGRMRREAQEHLHQLGLDIDASRPMGELSVGSQQLVEIARVIFSGADIIILDEPTSALSAPETRRLFEFVANLKRQGKTLIFVSHFLEDVLEVSDRVTVLKNSRKVQTLAAKDATKHQLIELMIGSDARILQRTYEQGKRLDERRDETRREVSVAVRNLGKRGAFADVSFDVHAGEIVGLFGFMGAGQNPLAACLFGADKPDAGTISLAGKPVTLKNTSMARDAGIAYVPENRRNSLALRQEIFKNITLAHLGTLLRGMLNRRAELAVANDLSVQVGLRPAGRPLMEVGSLSGGNQQKVVLAKWLTRLPKVLILNEPTRGMDVGAKEDVIRIVKSLREKGVAVLVLSTEPETILNLADRVTVLKRGAVAKEFASGRIEKADLLDAA